MTELNPINRPAIAAPPDQSPGSRPEQGAVTSPRADDSVELSPQARQASETDGGQQVREDVVARVRAEIAAGTYDTSDKVDALLANLLEDLDE